MVYKQSTNGIQCAFYGNPLVVLVETYLRHHEQSGETDYQTDATSM